MLVPRPAQKGLASTLTGRSVTRGRENLGNYQEELTRTYKDPNRYRCRKMKRIQDVGEDVSQNEEDDDVISRACLLGEMNAASESEFSSGIFGSSSSGEKEACGRSAFVSSPSPSTRMSKEREALGDPELSIAISRPTGPAFRVQ